MKKIFTLFAALAMVMSMSAKTIYLNTGGSGLWNQGGAKFGCHTWGSSNKSGWMTHVGGDIYSFETLDANTNVIFTRVQSSATGIWDKEWNRIETTIPADKDYCTIKGWGASDYAWSTYTPPVTHTFPANSTIYLDFRAVSKKGADIPQAGTAATEYNANAGGTVIPVTFTADVTWMEGSQFFKTEQSDWSVIPFHAPTEGTNCAQVAADGKSYTWTTYSEPTVTLSLDKTEADAGTEVTVTLTATADNVTGDVTYAFQYSTDEATWNDMEATGNTATQTFAAETRYYKVTMTNGGTTKEATAKFTGIKFHVIGSWDNWDTHYEIVDGSKTITLEADSTYEYKITAGNWDIHWGNNGTMTRDNCTGWSFDADSNAKITTDMAGEYVFNVVRNAKGKVVVSVTYPELPAPHVTLHKVLVSENLQAVVDQALSGDTVLVQAGTYEGNFTMKDGVFVSGGWNADFTAQTEHASILDAKANGRVLNQPDTFNTLTIWDNFTIQNGKLTAAGSQNLGSGVALMPKGRVINCLIQNNTFDYSGNCLGGGIGQDSGNRNDTCAINCIVRNNQASHGGGVRIRGVILNSAIEDNISTTNAAGGLHLQAGAAYNCIIRNNESLKNTGGVRLYGACELVNCLVVGNKAGGKVGGVGCESAPSNIINCTIVGNDQVNTGNDAVFCGLSDGIGDTSKHDGKFFVNNVIWGNTVNGEVQVVQANAHIKRYSTFANNALSDTTDLGKEYIALSAENNPQFNEDYSFATTSPLYNAGTNDALTYFVGDKDVYGNARKQGENIEIGAVEIAEPTVVTHDFSVENVTVTESKWSIDLSGSWNEQAFVLKLWQDNTQGFGTYAANAETGYSAQLGVKELTPTAPGYYTDMQDGTFTFQGTMTDGTDIYEVFLKGALPSSTGTGEMEAKDDVAFSCDADGVWTIEAYADDVTWGLYLNVAQNIETAEWIAEGYYITDPEAGIMEAVAGTGLLYFDDFSGRQVFKGTLTTTSGEIYPTLYASSLDLMTNELMAGPSWVGELAGVDYYEVLLMAADGSWELDLHARECTGDDGTYEIDVVDEEEGAYSTFMGSAIVTGELTIGDGMYEAYLTTLDAEGVEVSISVLAWEAEAAEYDVVIEDATVTKNNAGYNIDLTGEWEGHDIKVEVCDELTAKTIWANFFIDGGIANGGDQAEGKVTATVSEGVVTIAGAFECPGSGNVYNVTISGKLPEGVSTDLENNTITVKAAKVIRNGKLIIRQGDVEFNAQGAIIK